MNKYIIYELEQLEKITGYSLTHIKNTINDVYHTLEERNQEIERLNNIIEDTPKVQVEMTQEAKEYSSSNSPKKWKIKDGRFVVDKVLEDGSVIIAEEDEKIEPISEYLDYLNFDLLFPAISSKKFTHNELVIIKKVNEMIKRLNKGE